MEKTTKMNIKFREPISKELSNYLNTLKEEGYIKEVAEKHSYSPITLTAIVNRYRNVTENNAPMIIDLFRKCIANYKKMEEMNKGVNDLI